MSARGVRSRSDATATAISGSPCGCSTWISASKPFFEAAVRVDALVLTAADGQVVATPFTCGSRGSPTATSYPSRVSSSTEGMSTVSSTSPYGSILRTRTRRISRRCSRRSAIAAIWASWLSSADEWSQLHPWRLTGATLTPSRQSCEPGRRWSAVAVGQNLGLYRTSFLPLRVFRARPPAAREGLRRAGVIELAYEIVDADPPDVAPGSAAAGGTLDSSAERSPALTVPNHHDAKDRAASEESAIAQRTSNSVFVSYSHRDRRWLERLQVHLRPLERDFGITIWDDTRMENDEHDGERR